MLKLEKDRDVTISLRTKEPWLTPNLKRALLIASCLHALGLTLFSISPFAFRNGEIQLAPVLVQSEVRQEGDEYLVSSLFEENDVPFNAIAEPRYSLLELPQLSNKPVWPDHQDLRQESLDSSLFLALEQRVYMPIPLEPVQEHPRSFMHVSGPLAGREFTVPEIKPSNSVTYSLQYAVKVDESNGSIFWYAPIESNYPLLVQKKAEAILKEVRFSALPHLFVTDGVIEIICYD